MLTFRQQSNPMRLDASDLVVFKRELEAIDRQMYEAVYPENVARQLIPTQQGIPEWALAYTWRMLEKVGKAKIIANTADDLPRVDVAGSENTKIIKPLGVSHGYTIFEIKAAAQTGISLDATRASASRMAIENGIDEVLSLGSTLHNLDGLLNLSGVTTTTASTKTGGGTEWDDDATSEEIVSDVFDAINRRITALSGANAQVFRKYVVVIPDDRWTLISQRQFSQASDLSILDWLMKHPLIEDIIPWWRTVGAGGGGTNRMVIYPRNPLVIAGIVPMEFTSLEPEKRNLEYVIDNVATVGGIVVRYKFALEYVDGI